jgi:GNAT superfamily N-acetyltransferase
MLAGQQKAASRSEGDPGRARHGCGCAPWNLHLYVLYVLAADHGSGAGAALLDAVVGPQESAALWVADPNPRAHAFYRKHGFVPDGTMQVEDGVREIRMVRTVPDRAG